MITNMILNISVFEFMKIQQMKKKFTLSLFDI